MKIREFYPQLIEGKPFATCEKAQECLLYLKRDMGMTWNEIKALSPFLAIPAGTLWGIAYRGYIPPKWRTQLGLPELKKVSGCLSCGKIHITKRCTSINHKRRPPRISIRLDNPESAAKSIEKYMEPEKIEHLIRLLQK